MLSVLILATFFSLESHKHQHVLVSFLPEITFILVYNDILKGKIGQKVSDLYLFFHWRNAVSSVRSILEAGIRSDKFDALKQQN